jgi:DNA invertase Pin-like site-specific DNA recombinase
MQAAIGYLRVSTAEQGRSGLGLAAQRHEIESFGAREGFSIRTWQQDVQRQGQEQMRCCCGLWCERPWSTESN